MSAAVEAGRETRTAPSATRLKLTEIFLSLQGESTFVGLPTVFVRLTGCPLRCGYCDTEYAFHGGAWHEQAEVLATVAGFGVRHVCVTGGEPLAQKACLPLLAALCDAGHAVSLETSGALDVSAVDSRVVKILDIKTPGSREAARNRWANLPLLQGHDQIKFVICDRADYDWARSVVAEHGLADRHTVLFSPSATQLAARDLADWIVADRLAVRFQMQLHKILWDGEAGR
jgi:7-carboxy-7-deazaguanine synthase